MQSIFFTFLSIYSKLTFIQCHGLNLVKWNNIHFTFLFIYQKLTSIQKFHSNLNFSSLKLETFSIMLYKKKYELDQGESRETQNPKLFFFAIRLQSIFFTFLSIYSKLTFIQCHGLNLVKWNNIHFTFLFIYQKLTSIQKFHSNLNFSSLKLETFSIMLYKKKYELVQGESRETQNYFFFCNQAAIHLFHFFTFLSIYSKLTFIQCHCLNLVKWNNIHFFAKT